MDDVQAEQNGYVQARTLDVFSLQFVGLFGPDDIEEAAYQTLLDEVSPVGGDPGGSIAGLDRSAARTLTGMS